MDTQGSKSNSESFPQQEQKHPSEWAHDLSPNRMAGQNVGPVEGERERAIKTAYEVKELHRRLQGFADDELKQLPILPEGTRLQQNATYVDLADEPPQEFKASGGLAAQAGHYYVAKDRVPYPLWNRLIGEEKPGQGG
jgi:hypothetical protein